jgi:peptidoglycan/LPS O-acetylase OafA/YrhL
MEIDTTKKLFVISQFVIVLGLCYRVIGRLLGLTWYDDIYSSIVGNLDLYFLGMLIAYGYDILKTKKQIYKKIAWILLLVQLIFCAYCFYLGETTKPILLSIYRYLMPSLFAIVLSILFLNVTRTYGNTNVEKTQRKIAKFTFEFYLWHSLILKNLVLIQSKNNFNSYLKVLFMGFFLTCLIAFFMHTMNVGIKKHILKLKNNAGQP